jgi:hypothetical protein
MPLSTRGYPEMKSEIHPRRAAILDHIEAQELEDVVLLDDLDEAILGLVRLQPNGATVVAYSVQRILNSLVNDGMDGDEANEYFSFNIECLYAGPNTPVFVQDDQDFPL